MIKYLFITIIFLLSFSSFAGTCTTTTRSNYSSGQTLTSSALNADFNQLVTKANAFDGGCVTDGTLEAGALNSTDFAAVTNGIHQGCSLSYTDSNTVSVGKCILSVNGTFVKTTTSTNVTWGCSSCSSEVASTLYYVYAKTGSTGTTLNLLISTTAPGADGYDVTGNKVIGRFYNNTASAIDQYSVYSWIANGFGSTDGKISNNGVSAPIDSFLFSFGDTNATTACATSTCSYLDQLGDNVTSVGLQSTGVYYVLFKKKYTKIKCVGNVNNATFPSVLFPMATANTAAIIASAYTTDGSPAPVNSYGTIHCEGY